MRALLALLAIGALLALPLADAAANAPTLSDGDSWDLSASGSNPGASTTLTSHIDAQGTESITVNGTTYDAYKTLTTSTFTSKTATTPSHTVTQQSTTTTWTRASDGALLKTSSVTDTTIDAAAPQHTTQEYDYDAPCQDFVFPLDVGSSWTTQCTAQGTGTGPAGTQHAPLTRSTSSQVLRKESVIVGAGTFDAYVIQTQTPQKSGATYTTTTWWAPRACSPAKVVAAQGTTTTKTELKSASCAKGALGEAAATPTPSPTASATKTTTSPTKKSPGVELPLLVGGALAIALVARRAR